MKPLVVANWKMNPQSLKGAKLLFDSVKRGVKSIKKVKVVICPPFVYLSQLRANGAQDVFYEEKGAFTGEISSTMLRNLGVEYVILGHSERRKYQKETKEMIDKKLKAAISAGLKPILCIDKISQIPKDIKNVILVFEPLSAIGTGKPYDIEKAKRIRQGIKHPFLLYGGSVDSKNAKDYIKKAGFQGLLVGSASLNAKEFVKIVKSIEYEA